MKAKFLCDGKQMTGEVVKPNYYTVWVKATFKKKVAKESKEETLEEKIEYILKSYDKTIKRHKEKHAVVLIGE
jgi:hypothetical protein